MSFFGMPPMGYGAPLEKAQNLNDVIDKVAARANLSAASTDDVAKAANPLGTIIAYYGTSAPYGYLPCSGQTISNTVFPALVEFLNPGQTSATVPDLRGEFLRGWDNGRGVDTGRTIKSAQADELRNHSHAFAAPTSISASAGSSGVILSTNPAGPFNWSTTVFGGTETRPRNVSVLYCIKAYDSPVSSSVVDVGILAGQMDLKVNLSDFTGINQMATPSGYQKLPGGIVIQWGIQTAPGTSGTITFPVAFTNSVLSISGNHNGNTSAAAFNVLNFFFSGTPASTISYIQNVNTGFRWIAIGY